MKDWWNALSLRDQRLGIIGFLSIIIAILYCFVWSPLVTVNDRLHQQVIENNKLLAWMKIANKKLQTLQSTVILPSGSHSVLSLVQEMVTKNALTEHLTNLKQAENDSVQLHIQAIDFDVLIQWLIKIGQEHKLVVSQINLTPTAESSVVNGEMTLKKSS